MLGTAADLADGPPAPVAGMQAGMWADYPCECRQHPDASQMAMLSVRGHQPQISWWPPVRATCVVKATFWTVQSYLLAAFPIRWLGEKHCFPFSALSLDTHTLCRFAGTALPCPLIAPFGNSQAKDTRDTPHTAQAALLPGPGGAGVSAHPLAQRTRSCIHIRRLHCSTRLLFTLPLSC